MAADVGPTGTDAPAGPRRKGGRTFLPTPRPLDRRRRRVHFCVLGLILLVGLGRSVYWIASAQVWGATDEVQHFGYVQSIATGHGVPVVGRDLISDEVMASVKNSVTSVFRAEPFQPTNQDANFGATRDQYEAVNGPAYYGLMVPAYWLGRPWGLTGSLYAVRLATALVTLLAVPLTWALARRLLPDRPAVWLLAPAIVVAISGLTPGWVTNDGLVVSIGAAAILAAVVALGDGARSWYALVAGLLVGLCLLTKSSTFGLLVWLLPLAVAWLLVVRPGWHRALTIMGLVSLGIAVPVVPWMAWNAVTYGAASGGMKAADALGVGWGAQTHYPFTWDMLRAEVNVARLTFWQSGVAPKGDYYRYWERVAVLAVIGALGAAAIRRRWAELLVLVWCTLALPVAFISLEAMIFGYMDGAGLPLGRYFYYLVAPAAIAIAAGPVLVAGRHWGAVVVAGVLTWSLVLESRMASSLIRTTYLVTSIDGRLGPSVVQTYADGTATDRPIEVRTSCPVEAFSLGTSGPPPAEIVVSDASGPTEARHVTSPDHIPFYELDRPVTGTVTISVPAGSATLSRTDDVVADVRYLDAPGDPVIRLYCPMSDPDERAFAELYAPLHPDLPLGLLERALGAGAAIGGAVTAGLVVWAARAELADRR